MLLSNFVFALSTDSQQPIYIDSDSQSLDMTTNIVTFTGNVFLRQGSIRLYADKVIVSRPTALEGSEIIDAFGKPATFEQTMDDGKKINGKAFELNYDVAKSFLTMKKKAYLVQDTGHQIEGEKITYDINKQLLMAKSNDNSRVTTILQPQTKQDDKK